MVPGRPANALAPCHGGWIRSPRVRQGADLRRHRLRQDHPGAAGCRAHRAAVSQRGRPDLATRLGRSASRGTVTADRADLRRRAVDPRFGLWQVARPRAGQDRPDCRAGLPALALTGKARATHPLPRAWAADPDGPAVIRLTSPVATRRWLAALPITG